MERRNRLYLLRHGQITGYERYPLYGQTDVALTEIGRLQMQQHAERFRLLGIKAIFASDLERSAEGARLIARYHDTPVRLRAGLREMHFGEWEGLALAEVRERYPQELPKRQADLLNYRAPGGGETLRQFSERILSSLKEAFREVGPGDIVVVAHGGVNRVVICEALGLPLPSMYNLQQDYGCLNIIDYFEDRTLVRLING